MQFADIQDCISARGFNKFDRNDRVIFVAYLCRIFIPEIFECSGNTKELVLCAKKTVPQNEFTITFEAFKIMSQNFA